MTVAAPVSVPYQNSGKTNYVNNTDTLRTEVWQWTLANSNTTTPLTVPQLANCSVQVEGTFGGATIAWTASNDGVNYHTIVDQYGNAASLTSAGIMIVFGSFKYVAPSITGGSGSSVVVTACFRSTHKG